MFEQDLLFVISLVANTFSSLAGGGTGLIQLSALLLLGMIIHSLNSGYPPARV